MGYGRKRKRSSYPGSGKRRRTSRRGFRRTRRRTSRRRSGTNLADRQVHTITRNSRALNVRGCNLPRRIIVHLPYRWYGTVTTGTGGIPTYNQFRLNSPYDPDYTGVGSSARLFGMWFNASVYYRYRCYKADVCVTIRNRAASDVQAFCLVRHDASLVPGSATAIFESAEEDYFASRMLNPAAEGDRTRTQFKFTIPMHKFFGVTKSAYYAEDSYQAVYNTNPVRLAFLTCGVADDPAEAASGLSCDMEVSIVYHCVGEVNSNIL